jgi:hypothetical protein
MVEEKAIALRAQANALMDMGPALARSKVAEFKSLSDEDIMQVARNALEVAGNKEALLALIQEEVRQQQMMGGGGGGQQYQQQQYQPQQQYQQQRPQVPLPHQPERSNPLPLHQEQANVYNELQTEAELWSYAATSHEKAGHRAFTGNGYQEQYKMVQQAKRQMKLNGKTTTTTASNQGGFLDVVRRAIFGPDAY